jgi:hypothetical protein
MAIIIKNTENNKITFNNTNIVIDDVYVRLSFKAYKNGNDVKVELIPFQNKEAYLEDLSIININIPQYIYGTVPNQNVNDIHILVKEKLQELGFDILIQLIN